MSVSQRRLGFVLLVGGKVLRWRISEAAARNTTQAAEMLQRLINDWHPEVVVTEKVTETCRKGCTAKQLIAALQRTASHNYLLDIAVERVQQFANKYEEACSLGKLFPVLEGHVPPKRKFFEGEPRVMVLFEALSLGHTIMQDTARKLAQAMD